MATKIWIMLFISFLVYSAAVYTNCDKTAEVVLNEKAKQGWNTWQAKNCQSCHQIYGLGGYMGPDLTNTASDKGAEYMEGFIKYGTGRMPNYHLNDDEVGSLIAFLAWIDKSGRSTVPEKAVHWTGTYIIDDN
jgi:nitric oxide reductase subunit C